MLIGYVTFAMFRMSIAVVLPEIRRLFELSETQAGALFSSLFLTMLITLNLSGYLSDRIGRRVVPVAGLLMSSLGTLLLGSSFSYLTSLGAISLSGLGAGLFISSLYALMGEIMPKSRGFLAGFANASYALGGFVGPFLSGILTSWYNWRLPLYVFGAISFFAVVSFWFLSGIPYFQKRAVTETRGSYVTALKSRRVLIASVSMFAADFGFVSFVTWTPSFLLTIKGLDLVQTGTIFGTWALTGGAGAVVLGWLSDRYDRGLMMFGTGSTTAAISLFYYTYTSALTFPALVMLSVTLGFVSYAFWNLLTAFVQDAVDSKAIASVTGFIQSIGLLAGVVAPVASAEFIMLRGLTGAMVGCVSVPYFIHGGVMLLAKAASTRRRSAMRVKGRDN